MKSSLVVTNIDVTKIQKVRNRCLRPVSAGVGVNGLNVHVSKHIYYYF